MVAEIPYAAVWDGLQQQWAARISEPVRARHTPADTASLVECVECGLQHFTPHNPGDPDFYRELSLSQLYYAPDKWEFQVVAGRLADHESVLDVGCGDGSFLHAVRGRVKRSVGLDMNPEAVQRARAVGVDARVADVSDFAASHHEAFDVVTSFHVLEHLTEVRSFMGAMLQCVRPGGRLIVSVPYRRRILRDRAAIEPLDCPPHHISRWEGRQFAMLGERLDVELEQLIYQPPDMPALRSHLKQVLGTPPGTAGTFATRAVARIVVSGPLYRLYGSLGLLDGPRFCRHAMIGVFLKPIPS